MAFWGEVLKPGKPYILEPFPGRRLKIRQAMLGKYVHPGWSILECSVGDKEPVRLCALNPTDDYMHHLKLEYEENKNVVFSVSGNASIHLSGHYVPSGNGDHGPCSDKLTCKSASPTCLKRKHKGDEVNNKNDTSPEDPIISAADGKNDNLKEPIVGEDGKNDAPLKERVAKRRTIKNKKTKTLSKEHMRSDQNNDIGQVAVQKDSTIMEFNAAHIVPTQGQENTHEGNVVKCNAAATNQGNGQTGSPITDDDFIFTGATELQGVNKQKEDAEHGESVHAGKGPFQTITLDDGIIIEVLDRGKSNGKIASAGSKVTVKNICKLMNGQAVDAMGCNNVIEFKLGGGKVISGLDCRFPGMYVGGKRRLTIPPALGYGWEAKGNIPANSWLFYEVELSKVKLCRKASDKASVNPC